MSERKGERAKGRECVIEPIKDRVCACVPKSKGEREIERANGRECVKVRSRACV